MANAEATLEWPRFCYSGSPNPDENTKMTGSNMPVETLALPLVKKKISTPSNGVGRKRKAPTNKTNGPKIRKTELKHFENKDDQTVPSINRIGSGVGAVADLFNLRQVGHSRPYPSTTPPPPPIPEFAFSNMMRKMASKYTQNDSSENKEEKIIDHPFESLKQKYERTPTFDPAIAAAALGQYLPLALQNRGVNAIPHINTNSSLPTSNYPFHPFLRHLTSLVPNTKSQDALSAFLASTSQENTMKSTSDIKIESKLENIINNQRNRLHENSELNRPIDLSSSTAFFEGSTGNCSNLDSSRSDIQEDEDDENVDVLSIDPPASPSDIEQWSVDSVVEFVSNVESCQDYQDVFREHSIDGSALVVLSETHMTRILGMKLGPAFRLRNAITELLSRTNSPSFCITN